MGRTNTAVVQHSSHSSHRNKLKRTSYFLINLSVGDLLIYFTEPATIGTIGIPQRWPRILRNESAAFQAICVTTLNLQLWSASFLHISLERAFTLILPFQYYY